MATTKEVKQNVTASKVKRGHLMTFTYWGTIESVRNGGDEVVVSDVDRGTTFTVRGGPLVESASSADQFHTEKKTTKTAVARVLIAAHNRPFTVCFEKADGSERVLRGRLVKHEELLGRSMVEDLDIAMGSKTRSRLVDHRTIRWLVVDGTKHVVRK
jgi:hypothetical protein